MKTLEVMISMSGDLYWAHSVNVPLIAGAGKTPQEAMDDLRFAVELYRNEPKAPKEIQKLLKDGFTILCKFDTRSFLQYSLGILPRAEICRRTGINQQLLSHYATGIKRPSKKQSEKIVTAVHNVGRELMAVNIV